MLEVKRLPALIEKDPPVLEPWQVGTAAAAIRWVDNQRLRVVLKATHRTVAIKVKDFEPASVGLHHRVSPGEPQAFGREEEGRRKRLLLLH